jgi:hypothetical protein
VTRHQVYYLWQKANAEIWQRDSDPLVSATMLLSEDSAYRDHHDVFTAGNLRALGFFASETIKQLLKSTTQLLMDSTFGTNSGGMDLFAVLAEIEGTGVPLAYCLVELLKPPQAKSAEKKPVRADPGAMTYIATIAASTIYMALFVSAQTVTQCSTMDCVLTDIGGSQLYMMDPGCQAVCLGGGNPSAGSECVGVQNLCVLNECEPAQTACCIGQNPCPQSCFDTLLACELDCNHRACLCDVKDLCVSGTTPCIKRANVQSECRKVLNDCRNNCDESSRDCRTGFVSVTEFDGSTTITATYADTSPCTNSGPKTSSCNYDLPRDKSTCQAQLRTFCAAAGNDCGGCCQDNYSRCQLVC